MISLFRRISLALAAFFMPVEYLALFDFGALPITPAKFSGALLLVAGALQWVGGSRSYPYSIKHLWVAGFAFSLFAANLLAVMSGIPFVGVLPYFTTDVSILLLYFLTVLLVRTRQDMDWVFVSFILGACLVGASTFLGIGLAVDTQFGTRAGGLGGNPNMAAQNIGVALPMALVLFLRRRPQWRRLFAGTSMVFLLAVGFGTLSRSFFLSLAAMWAFFLVRYGRLDLFRQTFFAVAIGAVGLFFIPEAAWERLSTLQADEADKSIATRLYTNQLGVVAFVKNPVAGIGRRNFPNWASQEEGKQITNVLHNMYLTVAAEQGLIGLVPLLAILGVAWVEYSRTWKRLGRGNVRGDPEAQELRARVLGLQIAFFGILVAGMFHPNLNLKPLWLVLGLSTVVRVMADARIAAVGVPGTAVGAGEREPSLDADTLFAPRPTR